MTDTNRQTGFGSVGLGAGRVELELLVDWCLEEEVDKMDDSKRISCMRIAGSVKSSEGQLKTVLRYVANLMDKGRYDISNYARLERNFKYLGIKVG